jgi:hypothetical protein
MMEDNDRDDPEQRAFTGHPDHPPGEPDQSAAANKDAMRDGDSGDGSGTPHEGESPGDQGTNLPGYG